MAQTWSLQAIYQEEQWRKRVHDKGSTYWQGYISSVRMAWLENHFWSALWDGYNFKQEQKNDDDKAEYYGLLNWPITKCIVTNKIK